MNEAGIRLILEAPDVKSIMDDIVDDWKEINKQQALANASAKAYEETLNNQKATLREKEEALKKHKEVLKELDRLQGELADKEIFQAEEGRKGIFATIKAYFAQKAELKNLGKQIAEVNKELEKLDLRQRSISLLARRGNTAAIAEYNANQKKIAELSNTLGNLNEKFDATSAKVELNAKKFAGLRKTFDIVKTGALLTVAAVSAIAVAGLALITSIGAKNDQVKNQFERTSKAFDKFKDSLSTALAPIAFAIGKILEDMANSLKKSIDDNKQAVFNWAVSVAGGIAGTVAYAEVAFKKLINFFKIASIQFKIVGQDIAFVGNILAGEFGKAAANSAISDTLRKQEDDLRKSTESLPDASDAFKKASQEMQDELNKLGLKFFETKNLTQEQIDAIKRLKEEFKKLDEELAKQTQTLNENEAGPVASILLKAEAAAKAIEKERDRWIELAKTFGTAEKEIAEKTAQFDRLISATLINAQTEVQQLFKEQIDKAEAQAEDIFAENTGTKAELALKRKLKSIDDQRLAVSKLVEQLIKARQETGGNIDEFLVGQERANAALNQLEINALADFESEKRNKEFEGKVKTFKERIEQIKKLQSQLLESLKSKDLNGQDRATIQIKIDILDEELKATEKNLKELQDKGPQKIFVDVVQTVTTEGPNLVPNDVADTSKSPTTGDKIRKFFKDHGELIQQSLQFAVDVTNIANQTITDITIKAIDIRIAAMQKEIDFRNQAVSDLEQTLNAEATLKAAGLANDFDSTKKRLEDEIKLRDQLAAKERALEEKRLKAQRKSDNISQISSLTTAVANIFSKATAALGPFGVPLAIVQAAAMFISFAASKIQASKLATAFRGSRRVGETFGELAPGEGYNDAPGVDRGLSVIDRHGKLRGYLGGDEVVNKESVSRKHRVFLDHLNKNEHLYRNMNLMKLIHDVPDIPIIDLSHISRSIDSYREKVVIINNQPSGITEKQMYKAINRALKEHAKQMQDYHDKIGQWVPQNKKGLEFRNSKDVKKHL